MDYKDFGIYKNLFYLMPIFPIVLVACFYGSRTTNTYPLITLLLIAVIGIYTLLITIVEKRQVQIRTIDFAIGMYFLWTLISVNFDPIAFYFDEDLATLLSTFIFYLIIRLSNLGIEKIHYCLAVTLILASLLGIGQYLKIFASNSVFFPITGSFNNPGPFSGFLASLLPFVLFICIEKTDNRIRHIWWISLLISSVVLCLTKSRAAWISTFVGAGWIVQGLNLLGSLGLNRVKLHSLKIPIFICIGILIGISMALHIDSVLGRLLIWKVSINLLSDNFLLGIGFDHFETIYSDYQAEYFRSGISTIKERSLAQLNHYAFNEPLRLFAEGGVVGLVLIVYLVHLLWSTAKRHQSDKMLLPVVASLIGISVFSLFSYPFKLLPFNLLAMVCIAIIAGKSQTAFSFEKNILRTPIRAALGLALTLTMLLMFQLSLQFYRSVTIESKMKSLIYNLGDKPCRDAPAIIDYFRYHNLFFPANGEQLANNCAMVDLLPKLIELRKAVVSLDLILLIGNIYEARSDFANAEKYYMDAHLQVPSLFEPLFRLMLLHEKSGDLEKATLIAKAILLMPIKVHSTRVAEIRNKASSFTMSL